MLAQHLHVMTVISTRLVAEMVPQLQLRRNTADTPSCHLPRANQSISPIDAPRAITKLLPPVPRRVEDKRVEIDLPILRVAENEPRWQPWRDGDSGLEAELGKELLSLESCARGMTRSRSS